MNHRLLTLLVLGMLAASAHAEENPVPPTKEVFEAAARTGLALESCAPQQIEPVKYVERDVYKGRHLLVVMSERSAQENEGFAVGPFDTTPSEEQRISLLERQVCNDK